MPRHVRTGDLVMVRSGGRGAKSQRNTIGKVLRVISGKSPNSDRVVVEGVNICKKHAKPSQSNQQGGIVQKEMPIHISNVMPVVDGKPTRVRFETKADGSKIRLAVKGGQVLGPPLKKACN